MDGELNVQTVNGNVVVRGSRRGVHAQTVNGKVDVAAALAPAGSPFELKTVSGSVLLTLPKDAKFDLSAATMNGSIASTFSLPAREPREDSGVWDESRHTRRPDVPARRVPPPLRHRSSRPFPRLLPLLSLRARLERSRVDDDEDVVVDVSQLEREIQKSMKEVDVLVQESLREGDGPFRRCGF